MDFIEPTVFSPEPDISLPNAGIHGDGRRHSKLDDNDEEEDNAGTSTGHAVGKLTSRAATYRVRWMPLSLTSRTNAAALREAQEAQSSRNPNDQAPSGSSSVRAAWNGTAMDEDEDANHASRMSSVNVIDQEDPEDDEEDDEEDDDGPFGDAASAARLNIPGHPFSATRLAGPLLNGNRRGHNTTRSNLTLPSHSTSLNHFASLSPPSPSSFTSIPPTSLSPASGTSGVYSGEASRHPSAEFQEEKNSHLDARSRPYRP